MLQEHVDQNKADPNISSIINNWILHIWW